jgi:hypothetical protein
LKTASVIGTRPGSAARARAVRTVCSGTTSSARHRVQPLDRSLAAEDESAQQRRRDVVRMALQRARVGQHVGAELEHRVRRHQAGDDRRRARPESAGERDARTDRELEVVDRMQRGEPAHGEVAAVARDLEVGVDGERARLDHLELHLQVQRGRQHVEPRPEVRRGRGRAHQAPPMHSAGRLA